MTQHDSLDEARKLAEGPSKFEITESGVRGVNQYDKAMALALVDIAQSLREIKSALDQGIPYLEDAIRRRNG